jgi:hypothetical protein
MQISILTLVALFKQHLSMHSRPPSGAAAHLNILVYPSRCFRDAAPRRSARSPFTTSPYPPCILQGIHHRQARFATTKASNATDSLRVKRTEAITGQRQRLSPARSSEPNARINPPESTIPAPLDLPKRQEKDNYFRYLLNTGRAYWRFYKTGVKNTWGNYKISKELRAKFPQATKVRIPPIKIVKVQGLDERQGVCVLPFKMEDYYSGASSDISRAQFQLLRRSDKDIIKLPIFGLILAVFGEWTPLIVLLFRGLVPGTCKIPAQEQKDLKKVEFARINFLSKYHFPQESWVARSVATGMGAACVPATVQIEIETEDAVKARGETGGAQSDASPSTSSDTSPGSSNDTGVVIADIMSPESFRILMYRFMPTVSSLTGIWHERMLRRKLAYLDVDDALLRRDAGTSSQNITAGLSFAEVKAACIDRGIDVLKIHRPQLQLGNYQEASKELVVDGHRSEEELRRDLEMWIRSGGWRALVWWKQREWGMRALTEENLKA